MPIEFKVDGKIVIELTDMEVRILDSKVACGETWLTTLISEMYTNKVGASYKHMVETWQEEAEVYSSAPMDRDTRVAQITALPNYRSKKALDLIELLVTLPGLLQSQQGFLVKLKNDYLPMAQGVLLKVQSGELLKPTEEEAQAQINKIEADIIQQEQVRIPEIIAEITQAESDLAADIAKYKV